MDYRVDEKGKYYTKHVSKRSVQVVLRTEDTIVTGTIHLMQDNRLKDELNGGESFIAITNAQVLTADTQRQLYEAPVVIVNKQRIAWVLPSELDTERRNDL